MKLAILCIWGFMSQGGCEEMETVRDAFTRLDTEEALKVFIENYKESTCTKSTPYVAAAVMRQAEFVFFPYKKWMYFKRGKKLLEAYIASNPHCIEGRYVRLLVQNAIPRITGYRKMIKTDKAYILKHINSCGLPVGYRNKIVEVVTKINVK